MRTRRHAARHAEGLALAIEQARRDGTVITLPGPPDDPEPIRTAYGGDPLDDATLAFVVDPVRFVPDTVHHYFQPVYWSQAAHVPVTYLLNDRDRPIPPALQAEMITQTPQSGGGDPSRRRPHACGDRS